jgi:hypothetical protein
MKCKQFSDKVCKKMVAVGSNTDIATSHKNDDKKMLEFLDNAKRHGYALSH